MASLENLGGVIPPMSTPFTLDGEIDVPSLERLLRYVLDNGATGIFALGTTSETGSLSDAQRRTVLEATVSTVAGQVPVLAGVLDMSTARAIEHSKVAREIGVDAIVVQGPYYITPGPKETDSHFRAVHSAIGLPIMAYNIPQVVNTVLVNETVVGLAEDGIIIGIKDSSGNEPNFRDLVSVSAHLKDFAIFTGSERTADYALYTGAHGIVPGLGNIDPAGYRRLYDHAMAGDWDAARAEQARLTRLYAIISQATPGRVGLSAGIFGGFKTALRELGVIETNIMAQPMTPLNDEEAGRIRDILQEVGLL